MFPSMCRSTAIPVRRQISSAPLDQPQRGSVLQAPKATKSGNVHKKHSAAKPQPNVDDVAVWTELECVIFPSSQRRGGCAIKMPRSHKSGADGREARAR